MGYITHFTSLRGHMQHKRGEMGACMEVNCHEVLIQQELVHGLNKIRVRSCSASSSPTVGVEGG